MPDHAETLRAGRPLRIGSVTLVPIERVVVHAGTGGSAAWFTAVKRAVRTRRARRGWHPRHRGRGRGDLARVAGEIVPDLVLVTR